MNINIEIPFLIYHKPTVANQASRMSKRYMTHILSQQWIYIGKDLREGQPLYLETLQSPLISLLLSKKIGILSPIISISSRHLQIIQSSASERA